MTTTRIATSLTCVIGILAAGTAIADPLPPDATYRPLPTAPLDAVVKSDQAARPKVMQRQRALLNERYDLSDRPVPGVMMSGGRKGVQAGVRVKLPQGVTWDQLANMTPDEIKQKNLFPAGFLRLPHVKQSAGGQVFPQEQIDEIMSAEKRDLRRFDVDFDLPPQFTPEFPAPIFLQSRPDLGDVSQGKLLTIDEAHLYARGRALRAEMDERVKEQFRRTAEIEPALRAQYLKAAETRWSDRDGA